MSRKPIRIAASALQSGIYKPSKGGAEVALSQGDRVRIVIDRWPSRAGIDPSEIRRALGREIALTIPSDGVAVTEALNAGTPLSLAAPGSRFAKAFAQLADAVAGARTPDTAAVAAAAVPEPEGVTA